MVLRDPIDAGLYFWDAPGGGTQFPDPYMGNKAHAGTRVADLTRLLEYYVTVEQPTFTWRQLESPAVSTEVYAGLKSWIQANLAVKFPGTGAVAICICRCSCPAVLVVPPPEGDLGYFRKHPEEGRGEGYGRPAHIIPEEPTNLSYRRKAPRLTMPLTRRTLLHQTATLAAATLAHRSLALPAPAAATPARLTLHPDRPLTTISPNFVGLGYEISSSTRPNLLSPRNQHYINLVRTLSPQGVIRIGGNTADFATFSPNGAAVSAPKATVVNQAALTDLRGFLDSTGWQLIWSVNLGFGTSQANIDAAVEEAVAVSTTIGPHLLALEIGNEPDLFWVEHRPKPYTYDQFRSEYILFRNAILHRLPNLPLAGPDAAVANTWVRRFSQDELQAEGKAEPRNLKLLTQHYYREGQNPTSTPATGIDKLLRPDPKLPAALAELHSVSQATGLPYRICEVNSFSGGGRPGVSNTFASALWVLDYMLLLAQNGCSGVNMETGVNQLGFVSSYSPLFENPDGTLTARPEYYGMLAFAQAAGLSRTFYRDTRAQPPATVIACDLDAGTANVTAYALEREPNHVTVVLINKDSATDLTVQILSGEKPFASAVRANLIAPSLDATSEVTLGGQTISGSSGSVALITREKQPGSTIHLPRASAAIVQLTV